MGIPLGAPGGIRAVAADIAVCGVGRVRTGVGLGAVVVTGGAGVGVADFSGTVSSCVSTCGLVVASSEIDEEWSSSAGVEEGEVALSSLVASSRLGEDEM
jgi:hypothetical protein